MNADTNDSRIALYYDDAGYVETLERPVGAPYGAPIGLMGRQVAGKEFLDAYLWHGAWSELVALVPDRASLASLQQTCVNHPSSRVKKRRLQWVELQDFQDSFCAAEPPADVIHFPCPPDARFAWARLHAGHHSFALCGVTHTLCSAPAV
jgi:hypothetical protein